MRGSAYEANQFYGFEEILKQHARWPGTIRAVVPHGVLNPYQLNKQLQDVPVPEFFAYSWMTASHARLARKRLTYNASPFLYELQRRGRLDSVSEASVDRKLLVFPSHSTMVHTSDPVSKHHLDRLSHLVEDGWDVTVCLYFRDAELGRGAAFSRNGLRTVTCGNRTDPEFLARLISLIDGNSAVAGDSFGSHMYYASALGRPYFLLSSSVETDVDKYVAALKEPRRNQVQIDSDMPSELHAMHVGIVEAFGRTEPPTNLAAQRQVSDVVLGRNNLRSREDLFEILARCRRHDFLNLFRPPRAPLVPIAARAVTKTRTRIHRVRQRLRDD